MFVDRPDMTKLRRRVRTDLGRSVTHGSKFLFRIQKIGKPLLLISLNPELWKATVHQTNDGVINRQTNIKAGINCTRNKTTYWNKLDFDSMLNSVIVICVSNYVIDS